MKDTRIGLLLKRYYARLNLCAFSAVTALAFFALSLTPSLIPRPFLIQGLIGGICAGLGYATGRLLNWLYDYLEFPLLPKRKRLIGLGVYGVVVGLYGLYAIINANGWQNSIRVRVGLEAQQSVHIFFTLVIAALTFALVVTCARFVRRLFRRLRRLTLTFMPRRVANLISFALLTLATIIVFNNTVKVQLLSLSDKAYSTAQQWVSPERDQPVHDWQAGSATSHLDWGEIGKPGRDFIASGPRAEIISRVTGKPALEPLRIYVGYASASTAQERADLALAELIRVNAFERRALVISNPTGTGWVDPAFHDVVEYLHHGDIATVVAQYSYLSSAMAQVFEPEYAVEQATALFNTVYDYWSGLPEADRPALYLFGLSLGSWSGMEAYDVFRTLDHPISGILWAGPPFNSDLWQRTVAHRTPETPYVLPSVGEGRVVRFMSQFGGVNSPDFKPWRKTRAIYLQYASDAIVFFSPSLLYRKPQWLKEPRARDVSPRMRWIPIVTFLQVAADMALSKSVAEGYGHNYLADHYIDAWLALAEPPNWTDEALATLRVHCGLEAGLGCAN